MRKRSIAMIIGLMSFALLGVMSMQLYFLRQSYQMQSELFDRSVNEALNNVVAKVSKHDALNFLNVKARHLPGSRPAAGYDTRKPAILPLANIGTIENTGGYTIKKKTYRPRKKDRFITRQLEADDHAQTTGRRYCRPVAGRHCRPATALRGIYR